MQERRSLHTPLNQLFRHNLRHLLIFWIPCVVLLMALMAAWLVLDIRTTSTQEANYANKVITHINDSLVGVRSSANLLAFNRDVQILIGELDFTLSAELLQRLKNVQQQFILATVQYPALSSVTLHLASPEYFIFHNASYSHKTQTSREEEHLILRLEESQSDAGWYLLDGDSCYFQPIWRNSRYQGCIFMRMSSVNMATVLAETILDDGHRAMLVGRDGTIFADSRYIATGTLLSDLYPEYGHNRLWMLPGSTLFFRAPSDLPGCDILITASQEQMGARWTATMGTVLVLAVVLLLLFVFLLYRAAQSLCQPYETILALLNEPELLTRDEYKKRYRAIDKLGMISTLIHKKSYQYMALKGELSEKERMLREAQNAMLQAQMNPHFLFNTLDNIYWMAMDVLPEDHRVSTTIYRLSCLLRLGLQRGGPLTTVREEIEHARLYLEIQQIRMEHPFSVFWEVDEALEECNMLCLSLQPLLENAISHGIRMRSDGELRVSIQRSDSRMHVSVSDNGTGFTQEQLLALNRRFLEPYDTLRDHIGLANIHARLKLIYGNDGELRVESVPNQRTTIHMFFP